MTTRNINIPLLLLLLFFSTSTAIARQLTPSEALQAATNDGANAAKAFGSATTRHTLAYTAIADSATGDKAYYIFNGNGGFIVAAADDCAPALLGYSDNGQFDDATCSPELKHLLRSYTRAIANSIANGSQLRTSSNTTIYDTVEPLCSTQWGQEAPYWNKCPYYKMQRCYTGCVATAMAQIMKSYNYPAKGTGSHTYTFDFYEGGGRKTLTANFGATTYDWNDMLDTYTAQNYTSTQANAVATLMSHCGIASDMQYGVEYGSASYTSSAMKGMVSYFGYDKGMRNLPQLCFTIDEWCELLYNELANGRPMLYGGANEGGEGHQFVCDGYKDGLFHFNFGWGGDGDGYFAVTEVEFCYDADVAIGIRPAVSGSTMSPDVVWSNNFLVEQNTYNRNVYQNVIFYGDGGYYEGICYNIMSYAYDDIIFQNAGVKLVNNATKEVSYIPESDEDETDTFSVAYSYSFELELEPNKFPTTGQYTVTPVIKVNNEWYDMLTLADSIEAQTLTCTATQLRFTNATGIVSVKRDEKIESAPYIYNIRGERQPEGIADAPKGIYIRNGKSILKR